MERSRYDHAEAGGMHGFVHVDPAERLDMTGSNDFMPPQGYAQPLPPPPADYGMANVNDFGHRAMDMLQEWGPRVLAAAIILLLGYLIARAVKWAIASVVNKTPLGRHANDPKHHDRHPSTIGAQIGNAAFWLILLVAVMLAAQPLGLASATSPINTMLSDFGAAIPNIIGAVLIFFIGYIIATVAKKATEAAMTLAHAERLTARLGIAQTSAASLPKMVGSIVFALIIIPVAIAALEKLNIRSISDPATAMLRLVLDAIPHVLAAAIIVALAYAIGRFASQLITGFLSGMGFDEALQSMGLFPSTGASSGGSSRVRVSSAVTTTDANGNTVVTSPATSTSGSSMSTPSGIVGTVVMIAAVMFGLTEAFRQLNFEYGSRIILQILSLLGSVVFGAVIIAASVAIANFVSRIVASSTGPGFASTAVKVAIIVLGTAIGLRFMGLADDIINLAFGLILGAAALAGALAFGLGGRQAAAKITDQMAARAQSSGSTAPTTMSTPSSTTSGSTMQTPPSTY